MQERLVQWYEYQIHTGETGTGRRRPPRRCQLRPNRTCHTGLSQKEIMAKTKAPAHADAPKPVAEVLLLGLEGAGKTLLCRHLERMAAIQPAKGKKPKMPPPPAPLNPNTQPSIGIELLELQHQDTRFGVREVGGSMQQVWSKYYSGASAVLFVADSASAAAAAGAAVEVCEILRVLPDRRVCLFLNKRDAPTALSVDAVNLLLGVRDIEAFAGEDRLKILSGSALTGDGLSDALDWCTASLAERAELERLLEEKEAKAKAHAESAAKEAKAANDAVDAAVAGDGDASTASRGKRKWRGLRSLFSARRAFEDADLYGGERNPGTAAGAAGSGTKTVIFVRHGQSRWNVATKQPWRLLVEGFRTDHGLSARGYEQAHTLRMHAFPAEGVSPGGSAPSLKALQAANVVWSSPHTRAVQTAIGGLLPLWQGPEPVPTLRICPLVREHKGSLGRDNVGAAKGAGVLTRAVRQLGELPKQTRPEEGDLAAMGSVKHDKSEVEGKWWTRSRQETAKSARGRAKALLAELQASEHETLVVVSHSHFLRAVFSEGLIDGACTPDVRAVLMETKVPNCGVVNCSLAGGTLTSAEVTFVPAGAKGSARLTKVVSKSGVLLEPAPVGRKVDKNNKGKSRKVGPAPELAADQGH